MAKGLGCKATRVHDPGLLQDAFNVAHKLMAKLRVPVMIVVMLERVTG